MADTYNSTGVVSQNDPVIGAVAITTLDQSFTKRVRGIFVSTDGDLACTMADGSTPTFVGLKAGQVYPFCIVSITDTGTSITGYALV